MAWTNWNWNNSSKLISKATQSAHQLVAINTSILILQQNHHGITLFQTSEPIRRLSLILDSLLPLPRSSTTTSSRSASTPKLIEITSSHISARTTTSKSLRITNPWLSQSWATHGPQSKTRMANGTFQALKSNSNWFKPCQKKDKLISEKQIFSKLKQDVNKIDATTFKNRFKSLQFLFLIHISKIKNTESKNFAETLRIRSKKFQ